MYMIQPTVLMVDDKMILTVSIYLALFLGQASFVFTLPSVCVHNNTREQKTSKKQGRPGSIHHVSGRKVGRGRYTNI